MDWFWDNVRDEAGKALALVIGTIAALVIAGLKRLPKFIGFERTVLDELVIINRAYELKYIFTTLKKSSGALYIHVIRYHNGADTKHSGDVVHYDRMTIEYEIIGSTCGDCGADCFKLIGVPEVKQEWKGVTIEDDWRSNAYEPTCKSRGSVNTVRIEQMSSSGKEIFERLNIEVFKEIFICKTKKGTYTLGLSFCNKFKHASLADGMMVLAAKNLSNNLLL